MEIIGLSKDEQTALTLLAEGRNGLYIREHCTIPLAGFSVFTSEIRRKTGIADTKDRRECAQFLERYARALATPPSAEHVAVVRSIVADESLISIAYRLKINIEEARALYDKACESFGVFTRDERARKIQLRLALARHTLSTLSPIARVTETELRFLRLFVEGHSYAQIAENTGERELFVRVTTKGLFDRFFLVSRGRGAQRMLATAFLALIESGVSMDDPAF